MSTLVGRDSLWAARLAAAERGGAARRREPSMGSAPRISPYQRPEALV
jgi:hypothetical protein